MVSASYTATLSLWQDTCSYSSNSSIKTTFPLFNTVIKGKVVLNKKGEEGEDEKEVKFWSEICVVFLKIDFHIFVEKVESGVPIIQKKTGLESSVLLIHAPAKM